MVWNAWLRPFLMSLTRTEKGKKEGEEMEKENHEEEDEEEEDKENGKWKNVGGENLNERR